MKTIYYLPNRLSNTLRSYEYLCELNEMLKDHQQTEIRLSLKNTTFIQPNVIAVLGFIVEMAKRNGNLIMLCDLQPQIKTLFENYQFIGRKPLNKEHYMPYKKFKHDQLHAFQLYLDSSLDYIKNDPLKRLIKTRLTEIFINGVNHGILRTSSKNTNINFNSIDLMNTNRNHTCSLESKHQDQAAEEKLNYQLSTSPYLEDLFICGSINLSRDWLFVTLVNSGATFCENVVSITPKIKKYEPYECIKWAMEPFNSTNKQQGIGLSLIAKELYFKGGFCYCISGNGYYEVKKKKGHTMPFYLNGTIMTLVFPLKKLV